MYLTSVFHSYKSSLPDFCVFFVFVTMNNGNSPNGTFVFFDNIAAQELLSKAKVCFDNNLLFVLLLFNKRMKRLEDVRRIILHNTSLAASDYPYQKGYSVVCRCLISFHTVGNNNNNNKRKKERTNDEANITSCWWWWWLCSVCMSMEEKGNETDLIEGLIAPAQQDFFRVLSIQFSPSRTKIE